MKQNSDPQVLARVALTSLRLAHIQQNFFSEVFPDLRWRPVDEQSTTKAAFTMAEHVGKLFPIHEWWAEDFDAAESFSEEIPVIFYGWTLEEISDLHGDHEWTDMEVYLFGMDQYWGDSDECEESLAEIYDIHNPVEIWKIFLKLEAMLKADDERLREHNLMWHYMARRLRWLTANTGHQHLDRDNETHSYSGQRIPWEQEWLDGLAEQWRDAEPYMDSAWVFVNWAKESGANTKMAIDVIRLVCDEVAADPTFGQGNMMDVQRRLGVLEDDNDEETEEAD